MVGGRVLVLHALPLLPGRLRPSCDPSSLSPHLCVSPQCTPLLSDFTHMQRSSELTLVTAVGPPAESLQETGNERRVLRLILAHLHQQSCIGSTHCTAHRRRDLAWGVGRLMLRSICPSVAVSPSTIRSEIWKVESLKVEIGEHLPSVT